MEESIRSAAAPPLIDVADDSRLPRDFWRYTIWTRSELIRERDGRLSKVITGPEPRGTVSVFRNNTGEFYFGATGGLYVLYTISRETFLSAITPPLIELPSHDILVPRLVAQ